MNKMNEIAYLAGLVNEDGKVDDMAVFATKRHAGAEKIASGAKDKGGLALLTYEHFKVKLPYYAKAEKSFDFDEMKKDYVKFCSELHSHMNKIENMDQKEFQRLLGKMEVIGELLIKSKS